MTNEEAIKGMKNIVDFWVHREVEAETAKMAISALEKQIPQKPKTDRYELFAFSCPACNNPFDKYEAGKYCNNCGQALDWEE